MRHAIEVTRETGRSVSEDLDEMVAWLKKPASRSRPFAPSKFSVERSRFRHPSRGRSLHKEGLIRSAAAQRPNADKGVFAGLGGRHAVSSACLGNHSRASGQGARHSMLAARLS